VTEDEYNAWFARNGLNRTGVQTNLTEEWIDARGAKIHGYARV